MAANNPGIIKAHLSKDKRFMPMVRDLPRVAPGVGIADEPTRCYRVNLEWAAHIAGAVSVLTETQVWVGADDEQHTAIQSILQFLQGSECAVIDCNDIEDCLETSPIADAIAAVSFVQMETQTQAHIDDLLVAYDGTAQSIGSSIPPTAPDLSSLDDNALCAALYRTVSVYADLKVIKLSHETGIARFFQTMIDLMREWWRDLPGWLTFLLGDELYGCVLNVGVAINVLTIRTSLDELACCLREELRGVPMTQAVWDAALSSCVASLGGAAEPVACLMAGDNNLEMYVSFLELYNELIQRQVEGTDYFCACAPPGWFWKEVQWSWEEPDHSGNRQSPTFTHTNPLDGELFSVVARFQSIPPGSSGIRPSNTGLPDSLVPLPNPLSVGSNLWMWENDFAGVADGRDAVGWPSAQFKNVDWGSALRQPGVTFTYRWGHNVNLGHSRAAKVSRVRLLYKEV